jgi:hypothetical protein
MMHDARQPDDSISVQKPLYRFYLDVQLRTMALLSAEAL